MPKCNLEKIADNLGFPEGPVILPGDELVFCDGNKGELSQYSAGSLSTFAHTGGSPWGGALGADNKIYVTQGGYVPGSHDRSVGPSIQRVDAPTRETEIVLTTSDDGPLAAPNDLAFDTDGRLWFTDSGTEYDDRYPDRQPGRLIVADRGGARTVLELPEVYPNGIAVDAGGDIFWTESRAHRICKLENLKRTIFCELPEEHVPDGMAFASDGRLFVCTSRGGGIAVISPAGQLLEHLELDGFPTNCAFSDGTLYVTVTGIPAIEASQRSGSLWRITVGFSGQALAQGYL